MADYLLLMHNDATRDPGPWDSYLAMLTDKNALAGGSAIGPGSVLRKSGTPATGCETLVGFVRVNAPDLAAAEALVPGNPVYEAGGTVEIRSLPETG